MSLFDKMFKKNALDEAMENAYENIKENNPVTKKAKATIEDAAKGITKSLEKELYGKEQEHPEGQPSPLEDFDSLSAEWDEMIDQIIDRELGQFYRHRLRHHFHHCHHRRRIRFLRHENVLCRNHESTSHHPHQVHHHRQRRNRQAGPGRHKESPG